MPFKFVVLFGKRDDKDDKKVHILITNKLNDSSKSVIRNYLMRWGIEQCFKELKDTFYFDQYQVRNIKKIERYWNICLLAWTLTYWIKQNDYLRKIVGKTPNTFNKIKLVVNSLLVFSSTETLSKNKKLKIDHFKINPAYRKRIAA